MRISTAFAIMVLLALANVGFAASTANYSAIQAAYTQANITSFNSFLALYVPGMISANSLFINRSVGSSTYIMMEVNSSPLNFVVINTTNGKFSFVLNADSAAAVLGPYMIGKYEPDIAVVQNVTNTVRAFKAQEYVPINDCLLETGVQNYLCTSSTSVNICLQNTCDTIPICHKALNALGVPSPFSNGLYNFSLSYGNLNTSYAQFFNYANGTTMSNMAANLQQMSSLLNNIYSESTALGQNPVFPFPSNMTISQITSTCASAVGFTGPWYCYAIGYCRTLDSNYTLLNNAQSQISSLLALPFTNTSIQNAASLAITNAQSFYEPVALTVETAAFNKFMNSTNPGYISAFANLSFVAAKFKNLSLQIALSQLVAAHNSIKNGGITQNLTAANASLKAAEANAIKAYAGPAAHYLAVYNLALNTTALILERELDYQDPPLFLSSLATQQIQINTQLNGYINASQLSAINVEAASLNSKAKTAAPPVSMSAITKAIFGGALEQLLISPSIPLTTKTSLAPIYATALGFVIDLVIIGIIYMFTYNRLKSKKKLRLTPSVRRAWAFLFIGLFILAVIDAIAIFAYGSGANLFLPVSGFVSSLSSANTVYILTNSSLASNPSVQQCLNATVRTLYIMHNNMSIYSTSFNQNGCTDPANSLATGSTCIGTMVSTGEPVIMINPGNSSIFYRGLYGDILYVDGPSAYGYSCPLAQLVRAG